MTTPASPHLRALPFVGRMAELDLLAAALGRAAAGEPSVAVLSGEAGIGKTRVLRQFAGVAERAGAVVLEGACVALSGAAPYLPLVEALRRAARVLPGDQLDTLAASTSGELRLLVPELARGPAAAAGALSPELARTRLFAELLELIVRIGAGRPVVVALDDLQWADRSTLDVVQLMVRTVRTERLLVVLTYRTPATSLPAPAREALADVARSPHAVVAELHGLDVQAVAAQLAVLLGHPADPRVVAAVARRTQGNPFFVEQLAPHAEAGLTRLPARLGDVLLAALAGLSAPARRALAILALTGGPVDHDVLSAASGLGDAELDEALRAGVERQLVSVHGEEYAIRHALVQEALVERLLPGETRRAHAALAELLEARGGAANLLAHHWAAAGDASRAYPFAVEAGREAVAAQAFPEAHDHFEAALALRDAVSAAARRRGPPRDELLALSAEAGVVAGRFDSAAKRLREAIAATADERAETRALLQMRLGLALFRLGSTEESRATYRHAADLARSLPASRVRARVLGTTAVALAVASAEGARARSEEALAAAQVAGAPEEEAPALLALTIALVHEGAVDAAVECVRRAQDIARSVGDEEAAARAAMNGSWTLAETGRPVEAAAAALDGLERVRTAGLEGAFATPLRSNAVSALVDAGRLVEARALAAEPPPPASDVWSEVLLLVERARVSTLLGEEGEARAALERAHELLPSPAPADPLLVDLAAADARMLLECGDAPAALDHAVRALADAAPTDAAELLELCCLGVRAAADVAMRADALRRATEAAAARRQGAAIAARAQAAPPARHHRERVLHALLAAELARNDGRRAAGAWRAALAAADDARSVPGGAYASVRLAEALVAERAPTADVRTALADAVGRAAALGSPRLEAAAEALARGRRITTPATTPAATVEDELAEIGLTRREVEVLRHLASGRTNRGIAAELVISEKTAAHHVSSILTKLRVATRGEAAAIAHRVGLAPAER